MASLGYRNLLATNRNFRSLWIAQVISELGDWFNIIAGLALVMNLTGSGLVVTAILLSRTVPTVLFGPIAGVITDRFSRRTVLLGADYVRAVLALGFLLVNSPDRMWMAYLFSSLLTAVSIFFTTAKSSAIPEISESAELMPANALTGSTTAVIQTLGGAAGGFAVHYLGYDAAFTANALSFLASAAMIYRIRFREQHLQLRSETGRVGQSFGREFREGMAFIRSNSIVQGLMLLGVGWATGGGAAQILFSLFAVEVFHAGDQGIGVLYSAAGFGIVSGATLANWYFRTLPFSLTKWVLGASMVLTGVFYTFFSYSQVLWMGMVWMALSRVMMGSNHVIGMTLLMDLVPANFRGRTFSTRETLVILTMVVSMLLAGVGQHYAGPRTIGLVAGLLTLSTGVIWLVANAAGAYKSTWDQEALPGKSQEAGVSAQQ